jgi:hypothetical protein
VYIFVYLTHTIHHAIDFATMDLYPKNGALNKINANEYIGF